MCVCVFVKVAKWVDQKGSKCLADFFFRCQFALGELSLPMRMREENIFSLTKSIFTAQQQQRGGKLQKCWQSKLQASVLIT